MTHKYCFKCSGGPASSLMFCTNGVLLRMLTQGEGLQGVTHIIVDEVHERDRFAEFMLILLKKMLVNHPNIRLILMSATLHVNLFSSYFGSCPVIQACASLTTASWHCYCGQGFGHLSTSKYQCLQNVFRARAVVWKSFRHKLHHHCSLWPPSSANLRCSCTYSYMQT